MKVNQVQYLPSEFTQPTLNTSNINTYAFNVTTDSNKVCAVKIELTSLPNTNFSSFQITTLYWTGSAWTAETMYDAATGSTPKSYVDGLTLGDAATFTKQFNQQILPYRHHIQLRIKWLNKPLHNNSKLYATTTINILNLVPLFLF
jgi:hypothetical protein